MMKMTNLRNVYKLFLLNRQITRADIARMTGLNKMTVSSCVSFFLRCGVVSEIELSASERGRPAVLLELKKDFGAFAGIEVNSMATKLVVCDLQGTALERQISHDIHATPDRFVDEVSALCVAWAEKYAGMRNGLVGVSIAVPSNYLRESGVVESITTMPEWNGYPIQGRLQARLGDLPLFIHTAAEAGAMGEIHFGGSTPMTNLLYLHANWGITVANYYHGNLNSSSNDLAGRFGHTIIEYRDGRMCSCGNRGCLEAYASVRALFDELRPQQTAHYERLLEIVADKDRNDEKTKQALESMAEYLAVGTVNLVNIFNPDEICIGGYLSLLLDEQGVERLRRTVNERTPRTFHENLKIFASSLGEYGAALGCVSIIRDHLVDILTQE